MTTKVAGYDKLAVNRDLLLDLQFREGVGVVTNDYAKPHHPMALTGPPTWTDLVNDLTVLDFNLATPDFLECPAVDTADLGFTIGDFSLMCWVYGDSFAQTPKILCRSSLNVDGWYFSVTENGEIRFVTSQLGWSQLTNSVVGELVVDTWYLIGATRSGADAKVFKNGVDVSDGMGVHIDPAAAARKLLIGINDDETANTFDGRLWRPRIWDRCIPASEILAIFEMERGLFGV